MRHTPQPLRAGTMTVLSAVVILCLAVLAALSLAAASSAEAIAERSLALVDLQNQAECAGQEWLAALDAAAATGAPLPAGTTRAADGTLTAALPIDETHTLRLSAAPDPLRPTRWQLETTWQAAPAETLWPGA